MKFFQNSAGGLQKRPARLLCVLLGAGLALWSGCAGFQTGSDRRGAQDDGSLEAALAGLVPLPFDDAGRADSSSSDQADIDAASAAADSMGEAGETLFTASGEPILRPGLMLVFSLRLGDKMEVEPMRLLIVDRGEVQMPMLGPVVCDGLTLPQLHSLLVERYSAYYREPMVMLEFYYDQNSVSPWGRVLVQGRVLREGWVNIPPTRDLTVSAVVQMAGGFNTSARKSAIIVTRRKGDGGRAAMRVDLERVGKKGELERDLRLLPGDVVYVPESRY